MCFLKLFKEILIQEDQFQLKVICKSVSEMLSEESIIFFYLVQELDTSCFDASNLKCS